MKTHLTFALFCLLALGTQAMAASTPELKCLGTEPFWGISIDAKGSLSISDPMTGSLRTYSKTVVKNAYGTSLGFAFQVEASDQLSNTLKLNVVREDCNDGMSDNTYSYTAIVDVDGGIYFGCCK